jgi:hypothetical protein
MSRHVQAAGDHQHHHQAEAHGDLVADHLGRSAQRAQEGVLRVRRPAGDDHAVDLERGDRHQEQQAGVDVGQRQVGAEGITAQAASAGMMVMIGPSRNRPLLATVGR